MQGYLSNFKTISWDKNCQDLKCPFKDYNHTKNYCFTSWNKSKTYDFDKFKDSLNIAKKSVDCISLVKKQIFLIEFKHTSTSKGNIRDNIDKAASKIFDSLTYVLGDRAKINGKDLSYFDFKCFLVIACKNPIQWAPFRRSGFDNKKEILDLKEIYNISTSIKDAKCDFDKYAKYYETETMDIIFE